MAKRGDLLTVTGIGGSGAGQLPAGRICYKMGDDARPSFEESAMTEIRTRVVVGPDHRISGTAPNAVPPGEHEVTITVPPPSTRRNPCEAFDVDALPSHDLGPWPEG